MIPVILVALIVVLLCGSLLVKLVSTYLDSYSILLQSKCFRGPRAFPLIGNAHICIGKTAEFFERVQVLIHQYQSPFRLWLGPNLYFILHEPEHIKRILTSGHAREKGPVDRFLRQFLGDGLLTADESKWRVHRKVLQPSFTPKGLEPLVEIFAKRARLVLDKISREEQGGEFDIAKYTTRYTFDNICETTIGVSSNVLDTKDWAYIEHFDSLAEITSMRMLKPWLHPEFIFKLTSVGQKYYKCLTYLKNFAINALNSTKDDVQDDIEIKPTKSLVNLLRNTIVDDYKFSDKEIQDEISTLAAAGSETTSNLLMFSMYMLANKPDIQDKVYKEVREICGKYNSEDFEVTADHISRMEFLDLVLKETLRLFPVTVLMSRQLTAEINLGECTLPAGSSVMLGFFNLHRSPEHWPKVLEFHPERFLPKHPLGPRHPYAFMPFSIGARNCIGNKYATMSAKTLLATTLSQYVIKTSALKEVKDLELKINITLRPKEPIMLSFEQRILD